MWFIKEEFLVKKSTGSSGLPAFLLSPTSLVNG